VLAAAVEAVLESSGGLKDTRRGRQLYRDYLAWLSEEDTETKRMGFEKMCHGWIKGTKEFRKAVLEDLKDETIARVSESEAAEMREPLPTISKIFVAIRHTLCIL
jgi:hypothetical protein